MWPNYLHHLALHFAIVLPMVLALIGAFTSNETTEHPVIPYLQWGGWLALAAILIAVVTGLAAADMSEAADTLRHHRNLGILTLLVVLLAAVTYDQGVRRQVVNLRRFGIGAWWIASLSVIGTGHFGGLTEHAEVIPF